MSFFISPICVSISEPIECSRTTAPATKLYIFPISRWMLNRMCMHKSVFTAPHLPHHQRGFINGEQLEAGLLH